MKHFTLKASALAVAAIVSSYANAASTLAITSTAQATESYQSAVVYTMPAMVYTLGSSVAQDWYLTFTLDNGSLFTANPTATVVTAFGGDVTSATIVAGGTGANNVTFRVSSDTGTFASGDAVTVAAGSTITTTNGSTNGTTVKVSAGNGLLFIAGAVASPVEAVSYADGAGVTGETIAHFFDNYAITMTGDTDYIDVLPTPASNSRKVFGSLDGSETTTSIIRVATVVNNAKMAPDNTNDFATGAGAVALDTLTITLTGDMSDVSEMCIDTVAGDNTCVSGTDAMFTITGTAPNQTATATMTGANLVGVARTIVLEKDASSIFEPVTLTLGHSLTAAADATRSGMTTHSYAYAAPTFNTWPIEYVNGTVLRAPYLISGNKMRIVNASGSTVPVITATHWNDAGGTVDLNSQLPDDIAARSGFLSTITGITRGHAEVVLGGAAADVSGSVLYINGATGAPTEMTMEE